MNKLITPVLLFALLIFSNPVHGQEVTATTCQKLSEIIRGANQKYSMHADVDGAFALETIGCSVELRKELCAMEMVSFDQSAMVFDFETNTELEMTSAFFLVLTPSSPADKSQIIAFKSKAAAQAQSDKAGSQIITFDELVKLKF